MKFSTLSKSSTLLKKSPRPRISPLVPSKSARDHLYSGIRIEKLQKIYQSKCRDLNLNRHSDLEERFVHNACLQIKLRTLILKDSGLSINSAQSIGSAVRGNYSIAFLDVSKNLLKDEGLLILVSHLNHNTSIIHLDISSNDLSSDGSVKVLKALRKHPSIYHLNISSMDGACRNRLNSHEVSKFLCKNNIIGVLELVNTSVNLDIVMHGLKENRSLVSLNASFNAISNVQEFMEAVNQSSIGKLILRDNEIKKFEIPRITQKVLDLSNNKIHKVSDIFNNLSFNNTLFTLNLKGNALKRTFNFEFLGVNSKLKCLNISKCSISNSGAVLLSQVLPRNQALTSLYLKSNAIGDEGASLLAESLQKNNVLRCIDLSYNAIGDKGGIALARMLEINRALEHLAIKHNNLRDESGRVFSNSSRLNSYIKHLELENNHINQMIIDQINRNSKLNTKTKRIQLVPILQEKVNHLMKNDVIVNEKLKYALKNVLGMKERYNRQVRKLKKLKHSEINLLDELKNKRQELENRNDQLSQTLSHYEGVLKEGIKRKSNLYSDASLQLENLNKEIKDLYTERKEYSEHRKKQNIALVRYRIDNQHKRLKDELLSAEKEYRNKRMIYTRYLDKLTQTKELVKQSNIEFLASQKLKLSKTQNL